MTNPNSIVTSFSYITSQISATDPDQSHEESQIRAIGSAIALRIPQFLIHNSPTILNAGGSIPTQPKRRVSMGQYGATWSHEMCMILAGLAGVRPAVVAL
jgi:hypothetical protein